MNELHNEYALLFNGITDTIVELEKMVLRLKQLQVDAEEAYLETNADAEESTFRAEPLRLAEAGNVLEAAK